MNLSRVSRCARRPLAILPVAALIAVLSMAAFDIGPWEDEPTAPAASSTAESEPAAVESRFTPYRSLEEARAESPLPVLAPDGPSAALFPVTGAGLVERPAGNPIRLEMSFGSETGPSMAITVAAGSPGVGGPAHPIEIRGQQAQVQYGEEIGNPALIIVWWTENGHTTIVSTQRAEGWQESDFLAVVETLG